MHKLAKTVDFLVSIVDDVDAPVPVRINARLELKDYLSGERFGEESRLTGVDRTWSEWKT